MRLIEALDALGGPPVAEPVQPETQQDAWTEVAPLHEFAPGSTQVVYLDGKQIALFNVDGELYALSNRCPHARGPLSEGEISQDGETCAVTCPWHYAKFDLKNGHLRDGIASTGVEAYQVKVREGMIWVGTKSAESQPV
jgi:NAD(P)H-dependent nitrite reductase small subunit